VNIGVFLQKVIGVGVYICLLLEIRLIKWVWVTVTCEKVKRERQGRIGHIFIFILFFPFISRTRSSFFLKI
jgi:hypothetical protein